VEGVAEMVAGGRITFVETVRKAGNVGEHRGGSTASAAKGARRAVDVGVEQGEREAGKSVGVRRHVGAGKKAIGSGWHRHVMLRLLDDEILVVLNCLHHLIDRQILFFATALIGNNVGTVLLLHFSALLPQSRSLLLPSLLGSEAFRIGSNKTIVLLVKPGLTLLKAFPLLKRGGHVGLYTLHLAVELSFDGVEFTSDGNLIVTLLLPRRFLGCSLLDFFLWDFSEVVGLKGKVGGSIVSLADGLSELKDTLALALIASSGIGKAVAEIVDLLSNSTDGGLVVFFVSLQAVSLLL
jgi:hypothetical protein